MLADVNYCVTTELHLIPFIELVRRSAYSSRLRDDADWCGRNSNSSVRADTIAIASATSQSNSTAELPHRHQEPPRQQGHIPHRVHRPFYRRQHEVGPPSVGPVSRSCKWRK